LKLINKDKASIINNLKDILIANEYIAKSFSLFKFTNSITY